MATDTPVVQSIKKMAMQFHNSPALTWLDDQIKPELSLTYKELWEAAGAIADKLTSKKVGMKPGQTVILCFPFGIEFMVAMVGCMRAGVVAVSVYPPDPRQLDRGIPKLAVLVADSESEVALTTRSYKRIVKASKFAGKKWPKFKSWIAVDLQLEKNYKRVREDHDVQLDDLCFVQYTSGSTGTPKGVMVSHGNMAHNTAYIAEASASGSTILTWMPKYHDYALINEFAALTVGGHAISMSPVTFIRQPICWLQAVEKYKPHHTHGPTFSYKLTIKRLQKALAEGTLERCPDLSSLATLGIAAEPFDEETLRDIMKNFKVPPTMIKPAYGLAEACVKVSVDTEAYFDPKTRIPSSGNIVNAKKWDMTIVIADRNTLTPVPDGTTGTIYLSSPSIVKGYYRLEDINHERFGLKLNGIETTTFFDTMDLGFIRDGRLFINGRFKDLIIINGSNKYPQDIEKAVDEHPLLSQVVRPGCSAAFQMDIDSFGYIGELRPGATVSDATIAEVRKMLEEEFGRCDAFGLYPKGTIPKTTSGKVRRSEAARMFKNNLLTNNAFNDTGRPVSNMHELLTKYGVEDFNLTLADSGVDSLRLTRLIDEAFSALNITIDPTSITSVPAGLLGNFSSKPSPKMPRISTSAVYAGKKMIGSELFQLLGIGFLILTFASCSIPAWYFWRLLQDVIAPKYPELVTTFEGGPGFLIPGVVVVWMLSFSIAVIVMKWLIIGEYKEGSHTLWSPYFCRWWLVDCFISVWETYIGGLVLSTPWGNLFYLLLGANIHPSARLGGFVREHDLFTAGERSQISGLVPCRIVDARGLILKKTAVLRGSNVKVSETFYPGTVHNTDALSQAGRYIQKLIAPFFLFAAYSGAVVFASYITSLGGAPLKYTFVRLPLCVVIAHFAVLTLAIVLERINILIEYFYESPIDVLIDTLASTAENYLLPFTLRSVIPVIFAKLFGAKITISTEMSRFSSIVRPSKARFLSAGPRSNLSVCIATPTRLQPVRVGKGATVGRCAHLQAGCHVHDGASVSTNAVVPENATVTGAYFHEDMELPHRQKISKEKSSWKSKLRLLVTDASAIVFPLLFRAVFSWAPIFSIFSFLTFSIPTIEASIPSMVPIWLHAPILFLYFISCAALASEVICWLTGLICVPYTATTIHLKNARAWFYAIHICFLTDTFAYIKPFIQGSWIYNLRLFILGTKFTGGIFSSFLLSYVIDCRLIRFGKGSVMETGSAISAHHMEYFRIEFDESELGNNSSVHQQSYVMGGIRIGDNVTIAMKTDCKFFPGGVVKANKSGVFVGVPAKEVDVLQEDIEKATLEDSCSTQLKVPRFAFHQTELEKSNSSTASSRTYMSQSGYLGTGDGHSSMSSSSSLTTNTSSTDMSSSTTTLQSSSTTTLQEGGLASSHRTPWKYSSTGTLLDPRPKHNEDNV